MFYKLPLIFFIIVLFYLLIDNLTKEPFIINKRTQNTSINKFLSDYNQPYCPNMHSSKAKFWVKIDSKYAENVYIKVCCTTCYYKIRKSIECSKNKNGNYKLCKFSYTDIENLEKYKIKNKLKVKLDKKKLKKFINKPTLKYKLNNIYYPVQIVKYKTNMDYKDIIKPIKIKKKFKCKN